MQTRLENVLASFYKDGMIEYLSSHPGDMEEAIRLALGDKQPFSWRAAWLLWSCMAENDPLVRPYVSEMIRVLPAKMDGHQRELLKILSMMDIPEELEGLLFDHCVKLWEGIQKRPSIRYTAFCTMLKLIKKYPDLAHEMAFYSQDFYLETLSPGIKNAIRRMIQENNLVARK